MNAKKLMVGLLLAAVCAPIGVYAGKNNTQEKCEENGKVWYDEKCMSQEKADKKEKKEAKKEAKADAKAKKKEANKETDKKSKKAAKKEAKATLKAQLACIDEDRTWNEETEECEIGEE